MASRNKNMAMDAKMIKNAIGGAMGGVQKSFESVGKFLKGRNQSSGKPKSAGDQDSPIAQGLGVILGQTLTDMNKTDLQSLKAVNKDNTVYAKISIISDFVEELKKEREEGKDKERLEEEKDFREKLTEYISGEGAQQFSKDFCKLIEGVGSLVEHFTKEVEEEPKEEKDESDEDHLLTLLIESNGDAGKFFESIAEDPQLGDKLSESMKKVTEGVNSTGETIDKMKEVSEKKEDIEKFSAVTEAIKEDIEKKKEVVEGDAIGVMDKYQATMEKLDETNDSTKTVTDKADAKEVEEQTKSFEGLQQMMLGVAALAVVLIAVGLLADQLDFGGMIKFAVALGMFLFLIGAALQIAWDGLDINTKAAEGALILVAGSALIMLLGGAIMDYINLGNLVLFTATLGGFLLAIGWALTVTDIKETAKYGFEALALVAGAALIMFLGAAIVPLVDVGAIGQFTLILSGFLLAIGAALWIVGGAFKKFTKEAVWALVVVAGSALIMFLGAAIVDLIEPGKLVLFTITLAGFLLAIGAALWIVGKAFNKLTKNALYALALVAGSALIMFLGAAIIDLLDMGNLVLFTVTLAGFLLSIVLVFKAGGKQFEGAMKGAEEAALLVLAAGATLLIGGFVMKFIKYGDILMFTIMLDLLLLGVSASFKMIKGVEQMEEKAMGMLAVIGLGGFMMLAGGLVVSKFPELLWAVPAFTALLDLMLVGVSLAMKHIGKHEAEIKKGEKLTKTIAEIIGIGALSIFAIGLALKLAGGPANLALGAVIFAGVFVVIGAMVWGLGALEPLISIGAMAMIKIAGAILIASIGLFITAQVIKMFSTMPKLDEKLLVGNVKTVAKMCETLLPLAVAAGPLLAVTATIYLLAKAISAIAEAVGDVADLKVAVEWNQAGRPTKYRELKQSDFDAAGKNVGLIVSTLTKAIMKLYDEHPEWYKEEGGLNVFGLFTVGAKSPLERVIAQSSKLEKLMSSIAAGVSAWAKLQVPNKWDPKTGRAIGFEPMKEDFPEKAAQHVKNVVVTLTKGIMELYEEHKEWYASPLGEKNFFTIIGVAKSPLERVIGQSAKLEQLMSAIASGVNAWAKLQVPIKWDPKTGRAIDFEPMKEEFPMKAAGHVKNVVKTLTECLMTLYEENPEWYDSPLGNWDIFGIVKSPFQKVLGQSAQLQKLMSGIAEGVKSWALMQVPDKWDPKTGKPIHFVPIKEDEPEKAGAHVVAIVTTLTTTLMSLYEEHPEWYDDVGGWNVFGTGMVIGASDSPFKKVLGQSMKLSELMSGIAAGVKAWASLQVPDKWDPKTGKPISYRDLKPEEPVMAGANVALIVSTLATAIAGLATDPQTKELFEDEGGIWGIGASNKFTKVLNITLKLADLLSGIAEGVKAWATMQVPDKWDPKTGKPISFRDLKPEEPGMAAANVALIIGILGEAIWQAYDAHKDWYEDKSIFGKLGIDMGASPFSRALSANIKLSSLITNIAEGLQKMATLQMPTKWDKEGKPIDFKDMTDEEIQQAGINVGVVITAMGGAIMDAYGEHIDWFEDNSIFGKLGVDMGATPFSRAVNANLKLGELMTNIAKGLQSMANLKMPTKWNEKGEPIDFVEMTDDDIQNAGKNVAVVITTIGLSMMEVYEKKKKWFENTSLFGKIFGGSRDTPFMKVVETNLRLSEIITGIGKGMQEMSVLRMPDYTKGVNEDGSAKAYVKMKTQDFKNAGINIGKVIKFLGETMMQTYNDHPDWYKLQVNDDGEVIEGATPIQLAINGNHKMGELIKNMAEGIKSYSELDFAGVTADMSDEQKSTLVKNTFKEAAENIKEVCTTVGKALMDIANDPVYGKWFEEIVNVTVEDGIISDTVTEEHTGQTPFGNIVGSMSKMGTLIAGISEGIKMYASMQIPGPNGEMIPMTKGTFKDASEEIKHVIVTVGGAIMGVYEANPEMFGGWSSDFSGKAYGATKNNPFEIVCTSLGKMTGVIKAVAEGLAAYASMRIPVEWDKDGNPTEYQSLTDGDMDKATAQIGHIVSTLGLAIGDAYNNSPDAFETDFNGNSPAACVVKSLNELVPFIGRIGQRLGKYAAEKVMIWNGGHDTDGYKTYDEQPLGPKEIDKATTNIKQIILAIAQAVSETYNNHRELFLWDENSPAQLVAKAMDVMGPAIGRSAFYIGKFNVICDTFNFDAPKLEKTKNDLTKILGTISALYVLFGSDSFGDYRRWGLDKFWPARSNDTFAEVVDDFGGFFNMMVRRVDDAFRTAESVLLTTSIFTLRNFTVERQAIYAFAIATLPMINKGVEMVLGSVTHLLTLFRDFDEGTTEGVSNFMDRMFTGGAKRNKIGLAEFSKKAPNIKKNLDVAFNTITYFSDTVTHKLFPRLSVMGAFTGEKLGKIFRPVMESVFSFRYAIQALGTNFKDLDNPFPMLNIFKKVRNIDNLDPKTFLGNVSLLSLALDRITRTSIVAASANEKGFQILTKGINSLNKAMGRVKNTKEFAQQTKQLDKYVKAVNKVKLTNLRELYKFVTSVNKLAAKMGNLDKLTEALGNKLAGQLKVLSKELQEAKKTIERAEKLQDKRHKAIEDSIKKIDALMKEHMVVDIKVDSEAQGKAQK